MPNTNSSAKRLRQNEAHRMRNKAKLSRIKTELKKFYEAFDEHNSRKAETQLRIATKFLDKAAKTNLLHPNNVARKKSRMARRLNELQQRATTEDKKK